jgi:hypothetical protein
MNKGFWFSMDAILALLLVAALLLSFSRATTNDFTGLAVLQKQHDLVKAWQQTGETDIQAMQQDLLLVFPQNNFELRVENNVIRQERNRNQPQASNITGEIRIGADKTVSVFLQVHY